VNEAKSAGTWNAAKEDEFAVGYEAKRKGAYDALSMQGKNSFNAYQANQQKLAKQEGDKAYADSQTGEKKVTDFGRIGVDFRDKLSKTSGVDAGKAEAAFEYGVAKEYLTKLVADKAGKDAIATAKADVNRLKPAAEGAIGFDEKRWDELKTTKSRGKYEFDTADLKEEVYADTLRSRAYAGDSAVAAKDYQAKVQTGKDAGLALAGQNITAQGVIDKARFERDSAEAVTGGSASTASTKQLVDISNGVNKAILSHYGGKEVTKPTAKQLKAMSDRTVAMAMENGIDPKLIPGMLKNSSKGDGFWWGSADGGIDEGKLKKLMVAYKNTNSYDAVANKTAVKALQKSATGAANVQIATNQLDAIVKSQRANHMANNPYTTPAELDKMFPVRRKSAGGAKQTTGGEATPVIPVTKKAPKVVMRDTKVINSSAAYKPPSFEDLTEEKATRLFQDKLREIGSATNHTLTMEDKVRMRQKLFKKYSSNTHIKAKQEKDQLDRINASNKVKAENAALSNEIAKLEGTLVQVRGIESSGVNIRINKKIAELQAKLNR